MEIQGFKFKITPFLRNLLHLSSLKGGLGLNLNAREAGHKSHHPPLPSQKKKKCWKKRENLSPNVGVANLQSNRGKKKRKTYDNLIL